MLMANLQIKDLPEPLHEELRRRAAQSRGSVRDYVLRLIERDQALPSQQDWLDELATDEPVPFSGSTVDLIREGREERDDQLERAIRGR